MTIFASGLEFPEAPVRLPDQSFLFTEMSPGTGCVTWISADGRSRRRVAKTGRPNGDLYLTDSGVELEEFAPGGELNPAWERIDYDGRVYRIDVGTGVVETIDRGMRFTNGIAFGSDRNLYVAVFGQGDVTVLGPDGAVVRRLPVGGIYPTNLVFGKAGERAIYVTEAETGTVRRLDAGTDGFRLYC